jgi:regulator of protease activity HflC (stomatin/prohibitin superfamily)
MQTVTYPPEIKTAEQRAEYDRQFSQGFAARIAFEREQEQKRLQAEGRVPRSIGNRHTRRSIERNLKKSRRA